MAGPQAGSSPGQKDWSPSELGRSALFQAVTHSVRPTGCMCTHACMRVGWMCAWHACMGTLGHRPTLTISSTSSSVRVRT